MWIYIALLSRKSLMRWLMGPANHVLGGDPASQRKRWNFILDLRFVLFLYKTAVWQFTINEMLCYVMASEWTRPPEFFDDLFTLQRTCVTWAVTRCSCRQCWMRAEEWRSSPASTCHRTPSSLLSLVGRRCRFSVLFRLHRINTVHRCSL